MREKYIQVVPTYQQLNIRTVTVIVLIILLLSFISCKKFVDVSPPKNSLTTETVFNDDLTATAAISSIYTSLSSGSGGLSSITFLGGILADEATAFSSDLNTQQFFTNNILPSNLRVSGFWGSGGYTYIYRANAVLEGLEKSTNITASLKTQLQGEAKFIRAFLHLYLTGLYGDIPYITTTDYRVNTRVSRLSQAEVFEKIITDLKDAKEKLSIDFNYSNGERVKPNKWSAAALLARAYLYNKNWAEAEAEATLLINNTNLFALTSLDSVFLKNSREAIWQFLPLGANQNTSEGNIFILTSTPTNSALRNEFLNAFESGDNRKAKWVGSITTGGNTYYYPYKYKIKTGSSPLKEYSMVLRLGEQYLIRAEARAQQNNIGGAQNDLNVIRGRAGLNNTTANDKASLLLAVENERRIELFSEWGHRWFDLRRTARIDAMLGSIKTGWQTTDALLPIPQSEILVNPNMTQNPGY
jgi:hypothetical protein